MENYRKLSFNYHQKPYLSVPLTLSDEHFHLSGAKFNQMQDVMHKELLSSQIVNCLAGQTTDMLPCTKYKNQDQ